MKNIRIKKRCPIIPEEKEDSGHEKRISAWNSEDDEEKQTSKFETIVPRYADRFYINRLIDATD